MEFRVFFSSENGSERNSEVFSSENGLERNSKVLSFKNGLERNSKGFFLPRTGSERKFRSFSLPPNRQNSDGTPVCSVLFRIPRNNFFVGKWQPYSLCVDSVYLKWDCTSTESPQNNWNFKYLGKFKNKIEISQKPYSLVFIILIHTKIKTQESHASVPLKCIA
jgi:hypothetical protein